MTRVGIARVALSGIFAAAMSLAAGAEAQTGFDRSMVRIAEDYNLRAGDEVREVLVIFGSAAIEGLVVRDVVVVFGNVALAATASIDGSLTVVGGNVVAQPGAVVRRDLAVVGGTFDAPPGFSNQGEHVVIGGKILGGRLEALFPWFTRGLFWGRLIVPELAWVWTVVGIFFIAYLALNLVFDRPVNACAETLAETPLSAFVVGLLVLLLTGPVCVLLTVSVIGVAVVPFVLVALFVAWIIGKVGVARSLGVRIVSQSSTDSRLESLRSFAIGFVLITLAYMVPVLGFATWTMVGVFGLGSATLSFIAAYRRENPAPSPAALTPPATRPVAPPSQSTAFSSQYGDLTMSNPDVSATSFSQPSAVANEVVLQDLASFPRASLRDRIAAAILDLILVLMAVRLMDRIIRDDGVFLLLLAYHVAFLTWKGTTIGGIICQLRVVRVDGAPLRFIDALVRGLSSLFSTVVLGLGFLWILKDPERQAWHDRIAGTYVVKAPRNWPL